MFKQNLNKKGKDKVKYKSLTSGKSDIASARVRAFLNCGASVSSYATTLCCKSGIVARQCQ